MVSASITLCLDILHRPRAEPEFAEHKKLVDQAVALLRRYDDSTLAVHGVRLLSLLLEGATKQQPAMRDARHDNEKNGSWAWPLEDRQNIDAVWAFRQSNTKINDHLQSTVSPVTPLVRGRRSRASSTSSSEPLLHKRKKKKTSHLTPFRDNGCHDVPTETNNDLKVLNGEGSFNAINDNSVVSDILWWTGFFSDYFPAQSIFENRSIIEDLITQAA